MSIRDWFRRDDTARAAEPARATVADPPVVINADEQTAVEKESPSTAIGVTGLNRWGDRGSVNEEFLRQLSGRKAYKVYREMRDNDPVVGAVLFAIRMVIRNVKWRVEGGDEKAHEFVESCMHDMGQSWANMLSEILTMLPFGWSLFEITYKRRGGDKRDVLASSKHSDGMIGWKSWGLRAQDTLDSWVWDEDGNIEAMIQSAPPMTRAVEIPMDRCLLFRVDTEKNNPEGRALDPTTPIPTPDGWRVMDDMQIGDKVFDEQGKIRYVVGRADWDDRPCYEIEFNDGSVIVADENHEWITETLYERIKGKAAKKRTTKEIADNFKTLSDVSNHAIQWAGPLDYPRQQLLVPPYYLGLWLGDGTSRTSTISCHADDAEETAAAIASLGFSVRIENNGPTGCNGRTIKVFGDTLWASDGPTQMLRAIGVLENKHVPQSYLRGSVTQRMDLLAGLMDSDGTVDVYGRCEFVNTNIALVHGVAELVRSLGCGVSVALRKKAVEGVTKAAWAAKFTPSFSPFKLSRKAARTINKRARKRHYIVSVVPVENRRTVCIEVDGPSHCYLAGDSMVPTHNSILRNAYEPWYYAKHLQRIEAIGHERDLAGIPVIEAVKSAYDSYGAILKRILTQIKRDEQEGVLLPQSYDDKGNPAVKLSLLSAAGSRQLDIDKTITRYQRLVAITVMADFVMMGHEKVGSLALASSKTSMFALAVGAILDQISSEINDREIPRLLRYNGMSTEDAPRLIPGDIETPDPKELAAYITAMAGAGVLSTPDDDLENHLRAVMGMPEKPEGDMARPNPRVLPNSESDVPESDVQDEPAADEEDDVDED